MATVINIRRRKIDDPPYTYIGRGSLFGNPFDVWQFGRDVSCDKYAEWVVKQPKIMEAIAKMKSDVVLGCFCKPSRCHGDWIAEQINNRNG